LRAAALGVRVMKAFDYIMIIDTGTLTGDFSAHRVEPYNWRWDGGALHVSNV
jgi:hypothetical protein